MKYYSLFFLGLFLAISFASFGQSSASVQRKLASLEAKGHYVEAAKLHMSLHDKGEREASINAAMNLYKIGKYKEAQFYFQHADSIGSLDKADEIFAYFECLKSAKKYKEANLRAPFATGLSGVSDGRIGTQSKR